MKAIYREIAKAIFSEEEGAISVDHARERIADFLKEHALNGVHIENYNNGQTDMPVTQETSDLLETADKMSVNIDYIVNMNIRIMSVEIDGTKEEKEHFKNMKNAQFNNSQMKLKALAHGAPVQAYAGHMKAYALGKLQQEWVEEKLGTESKEVTKFEGFLNQLPETD